MSGGAGIRERGLSEPTYEQIIEACLDREPNFGFLDHVQQLALMHEARKKLMSETTI